MLSLEGVLLYCNPCLAELFKMSVENLTGRMLVSFVAEADQAKLADLIMNSERTSALKEVRLCRQDGITFPAAAFLPQRIAFAESLSCWSPI